jgi:hypothetical protein
VVSIPIGGIGELVSVKPGLVDKTVGWLVERLLGVVFTFFFADRGRGPPPSSSVPKNLP